jgi:hypothetical protein
MKVLLAAHRDLTGALAVVDRHRHDLIGRLQELRRHQRAVADGLPGRLVADMLAVRVEADLRWLDLTEERLRAAATDRQSSDARRAAT